ncbi:MAG: hypothetical protein WBA54_09740 [Acidaminobacteraceae bacterium]
MSVVMGVSIYSEKRIDKEIERLLLKSLFSSYSRRTSEIKKLGDISMREKFELLRCVPIDLLGFVNFTLC